MAMQFPKGKFISMVKDERKGADSMNPKGARDLFTIQPGDNLLLLADEEKGIALVPVEESLDTPASLFALGREVSRDDDSKGWTRLSKRYPAFCLRDVGSSNWKKGALMGLIGRNGAGKTTTIKSILRLVRPDGGTVRISGKASGYGRVCTSPGGRLCVGRPLLLSEKASFAADRRHEKLLSLAWDDKKYEALLHRFSLDETKRVCELSAGMKVKYQLACALSHGAKLLILDEPTSRLDPVSRDDLLDLLRTLCEQGGVSILFSTHITTDLDACADDVTYLQNGTVAASCPLAEFTAPWKKLTGKTGELLLSPELKKTLRGLRVHRGEFEGLPQAHLPALRDAGKKRQITQSVMVFLEREVERV